MFAWTPVLQYQARSSRVFNEYLTVLTSTRQSTVRFCVYILPLLPPPLFPSPSSLLGTILNASHFLILHNNPLRHVLFLDFFLMEEVSIR